MEVESKLKHLRTAIPYIRAYKGRVFVVKIGGRLCEPGAALQNLVEQVALLYQLGIRVVLVHGGGDQIDALCTQLEISPQFFAGRRITDEKTLEVVTMALAGTVNTRLVAAFRPLGAAAVGLSGIDGDLLQAVKRPARSTTDPSTGETRDVDFGFVGDIVGVNTGVLENLLNDGHLPVVCTLAATSAGQILNVNADTVAAKIAVAIKAAKYFSVTEVDGVMGDVDDPKTLRPYLDIEELEQLTKSGVVGGGMLPKLAACTEALRGGVPRVHVINGLVPDTILSEVFTNEGCGTLIVAERDAVKPA